MRKRQKLTTAGAGALDHAAPRGQDPSATAEEVVSPGAAPADLATGASPVDGEAPEPGAPPPETVPDSAASPTDGDAAGPEFPVASAPLAVAPSDEEVDSAPAGTAAGAVAAADGAELPPAEEAHMVQAETAATVTADEAPVPELQRGIVPANLLVQSEQNTRKTKGALKIEELAASILKLGLLQNLAVSCRADGSYPVEAGERRRLAIAHLVAKGRVPENWPVPVIYVDAADRTAVSAIENEQRMGMHPIDQFEAFRDLATDGWTIEAIAAVFGVTPLVVERRLALAKAAPALLELFRRDEIATDQLMALCATDDHVLQVAAWTGAAAWNRDPAALRRSVLSTEIDASRDARVAFIGGIEAFVAAGGEVRRDLFSGDGHGGFISDAALLERLVEQKLEAVADEVRAEGWGWVEIWRTWNYTELYRLGRLQRTVKPLSPDAAAKVEALRAEHDRLSAEADAFAEAGGGDYDELDGEERDRYDALCACMEEIDVELKAIQQERDSFDPEALALAGAVVGIEHGKLQIERGLVRTADRAKVTDAAGGAAQAVSGGRESAVSGRKKGELSDGLTRSLYGHRNLAAQTATAANPHVAKVLLACWMVQTLRFQSSTVPIDLHIVAGAGTRTYHEIADDSGESKRKAFDAVGAALVAALPKEDAALWEAVMTLGEAELDGLIAFAVASAVSLDRSHKGFTAKLLDALGFDMADHFQPTAANYFSRVSKAQILEALREAGKLGSAAQQATLQTLKKPDLAARAEGDLANTRWVPAAIRTPKAKVPRKAKPKKASTPTKAGAAGDDVGRARRKKQSSAAPATRKRHRSGEIATTAPNGTSEQSTERLAA